MEIDAAATAFREFVSVIKQLRTPATGCPWDLEQDHLSLRPFLIEEAYEVLDAIDRGDDRGLREELGDLLLQVVLHAQVADDRGAFSIIEVVEGIASKMVRRHPHVFGSAKAANAGEVIKNWDQIKAEEAKEKGHDSTPGAALARLPEALPALQRAQRLGEKAAKIRKVASTATAMFEEIRGSLTDLQLHADNAKHESVRRMPDDNRAAIESKVGGLLFAICEVAQQLGISAEDSLRAYNREFIERFGSAS